MLVAAIDCSTISTCVGWVELDEHGQPLRFAELSAPALPGHAETVLGRLSTILATASFQLTDPQLFVYGRGPGTFTGLRIGLASVKGLCLASNAALKGVSSLEALALGAPEPTMVAAIGDARRGELFAGLFRVSSVGGVPGATALMDETVGPVALVLDELANRIGQKPALALGSGIVAHTQAAAQRLGPTVQLAGPLHAAPRPLWLCLAGYEAFVRDGGEDLDSAEPVYLREPDAREPKPPIWARAKPVP